MAELGMNDLTVYEENKTKANKIIRFRTLMASGIGFLPFPILDAAGILSIQLWMIRDIAKVYDVPFRKNVARSIITSLIGNIGTVGIIKLIPGINLLGSGAMAATAGASTYALGKVFIQHFDQGGTLLSFDPIKSRAYFQQVFEEGKVTVKELQEQESSFKEVDTQALASITVLKKTNHDLMETIQNLENQLKESKKERAAAMAIAKSRAKPLPENKKQRGFLWWLFRILIIIAIGGLAVFALFKFGIIGNDEDTKEKSEIVKSPEKTKNSKNTNASIINIEEGIIDTVSSENLTDTINADNLTDTLNVPENNITISDTNSQAADVVVEDTSSVVE